MEGTAATGSEMRAAVEGEEILVSRAARGSGPVEHSGQGCPVCLVMAMGPQAGRGEWLCEDSLEMSFGPASLLGWTVGSADLGMSPAQFI